MSLVLDGSVALSWRFEDERTPASAAVLARVVEAGAVVPRLWHLGVANGLQKAVRRGRLTLAKRDAATAGLNRLPVEVDGETEAHAWEATLRLSDQFGLTPYDAAYVELALRRGLPLATLDGPMRAAAARLGLALLGAGA